MSTSDSQQTHRKPTPFTGGSFHSKSIDKKGETMTQTKTKQNPYLYPKWVERIRRSDGSPHATLEKLTRVSKLILLTGLIMGTEKLKSDDVTLAWNPCVDPTVTGYILYYGDTKSREYKFSIDAGNNTSQTASNLVEGTTNYFAVTAYNAQGQESPYSNEVEYIIPRHQVNVNITTTIVNGVVKMSFPVIPNHTYQLQSSKDLKTWTTVMQMVTPSVIPPNAMFQYNSTMQQDKNEFFRAVQE